MRFAAGCRKVDGFADLRLAFRVVTDSLRTATVGELPISPGEMTMPVIMGVGDLAWQAEGISAPELVEADVLCADVEEWSGKPVTLGHPAGGEVTQADWHGLTDTPVVGRIVTAGSDGPKLRSEIVLFEGRRQQVIDSVDPNEPMMNVSIGIRAATDHTKKGVDRQGRSYTGAWSRITKRDHLALLPHDRGACSIEMGAGFPRTNKTGGDMTLTDETKKLIAGLDADALKGILSAETLKALGPQEAAGGDSGDGEGDTPDSEDKSDQRTNKAADADKGDGQFDKVLAAIEGITKKVDTVETKLASFDAMAAEHAGKADADKASAIDRLIACKLYEDSDKESLDKRSLDSLQREVRAAEHGAPASTFSTLSGGPRQEPGQTRTATQPRRWSDRIKKQKEEAA